MPSSAAVRIAPTVPAALYLLNRPYLSHTFLSLALINIYGFSRKLFDLYTGISANCGTGILDSSGHTEPNRWKTWSAIAALREVAPFMPDFRKRFKTSTVAFIGITCSEYGWFDCVEKCEPHVFIHVIFIILNIFKSRFFMGQDSWIHIAYLFCVVGCVGVSVACSIFISIVWCVVIAIVVSTANALWLGLPNGFRISAAATSIATKSSSPNASWSSSSWIFSCPRLICWRYIYQLMCPPNYSITTLPLLHGHFRWFLRH